jgi:hypothetical protein
MILADCEKEMPGDGRNLRRICYIVAGVMLAGVLVAGLFFPDIF